MWRRLLFGDLDFLLLLLLCALLLLLLLLWLRGFGCGLLGLVALNLGVDFLAVVTRDDADDVLKKEKTIMFVTKFVKCVKGLAYF